MSKDEKIFTFRLDAELLNYLKRRADVNKRSIAKELEYIVENLRIRDKKEIEMRSEMILKTLSKGKDLTKEDIIKIISADGVLLPAEEILKDFLAEL